MALMLGMLMLATTVVAQAAPCIMPQAVMTMAADADMPCPNHVMQQECAVISVAECADDIGTLSTAPNEVPLKKAVTDTPIELLDAPVASATNTNSLARAPPVWRDATAQADQLTYLSTQRIRC